MKNKQYFYLVAISTNKAPETYVVPNKITLQEYEAVKYGRKLATSIQNDGLDNKVRLYRQLIARNGNIEFLRELNPFKVDLKPQKFGNYDKSNKDNRYIIHWRSESSGMKPTLISGKDEADAVNKAGYGAGALGAVDWIEKLNSKDFIETPCGRIYILKGKQVGGLIQPRKATIGGWITGISFCEGDQYETYITEEQVQIDWEYLKKVLF